MFEFNLDNDRAQRGGGFGPPAGLTMPFTPPDLRLNSPDARSIFSGLTDPPDKPISVSQAFGVVTNAIADCVAAAEPDAREGAQKMLDEALAFKGRIEAFLNAQRDGRLVELKRRHEELYSQCRRALDELQAATLGLHGAENAAHSLLNPVSASRARLRDLENSRPAPGLYPTAQEIHEWQDRLDVAKSANAELERRSMAADSAVGAAEQRAQRAQREFQRLQGEERALAQRIADGAPVEQVR